MQERSGTVIGALVLFLLIFPLGFLVHVSPRFAGSLAGGLVGIAGVALMLVTLAYVFVKRIPALRTRIEKRVSMRTLLAIHIYAGIVGPILGLVHAAHKYESPLGVSLTGIMILVVITGYIACYFLAQVARAIRGRKSELTALKTAFDGLPLATGEDPDVPLPAPAGKRRWLSLLLVPNATASPPAGGGAEAGAIAGAIADTEYAIRSEEVANSLLGASLKLHIAMAIILLALLALHIWSGFYYGLRWL